MMLDRGLGVSYFTPTQSNPCPPQMIAVSGGCQTDDSGAQLTVNGVPTPIPPGPVIPAAQAVQQYNQWVTSTNQMQNADVASAAKGVFTNPLSLALLAGAGLILAEAPGALKIAAVAPLGLVYLQFAFSAGGGF